MVSRVVEERMIHKNLDVDVWKDLLLLGVQVWTMLYLIPAKWLVKTEWDTLLWSILRKVYFPYFPFPSPLHDKYKRRILSQVSGEFYSVEV